VKQALLHHAASETNSLKAGKEGARPWNMELMGGFTVNPFPVVYLTIAKS